MLAGCTKKDEPPRAPAAAAVPRGEPVAYAYESLDDREVSLAALKGRATVLVFIATYGDASIVQARFLKKVVAEHVPRINAAAVFMEPIENRPLARIFRDTVGLPYPLAMADSPTIAGHGPFVGLDTVPSVVVLDDEGREVFRKVGVAYPDELIRAVRDAQSSVWGAPRKLRSRPEINRQGAKSAKT
jgi:hypothetical protein